MPDKYNDHRDKQRRWMHRPAPHTEHGYESRIFAEGEHHDPAEGWTHYPHDAIARCKVPQAAQEAPQSPVALPDDDDSEEITLEAQLAALKRPALFKMATEMGVVFETGWTAAELRKAILNRE